MKKIKLYNKIANIGLERFPDDYIVKEEMQDEDAILVRSSDLHKIVLHDQLKAIARAGAGTNNIPIDTCSEKGIIVFNTPGANANAVKELVVAGMLLGARPVYEAMQWMETVDSNQDVAKLVEKEKSRFKGHELYGKKLGIIGLGAIGIQVANLALHLGMEVYGYDPYISIQAAWNLSRNVIQAKSQDEIYRSCDYISIHVPLNDTTRNMLQVEAFQKMKKDAFILNFARGGLVHEQDLKKALDSHQIRGYVTDFPSGELMHHSSVYAIPHLGASTSESEDNCAIMAVDQIKDYLENGNIVNAVNLPSITMERSGAARVACFHRNIKSMIAKISNVISDAGLNIENLINKSKGDYAYTIVDVDDIHVDKVVKQLQEIDDILKVTTY